MLQTDRSNISYETYSDVIDEYFQHYIFLLIAKIMFLFLTSRPFLFWMLICLLH